MVISVTTSIKLFAAAALVAVGIGGFWFYFNHAADGTESVPGIRHADTAKAPDAASAPIARSSPLPVLAPDGSIVQNASAAKYQAPNERSLDMQIFDKAVLYLMDVQEPDGHFDSAKTGAAPEFCNLNGDIALTALAAWAMMASSLGQSQNPVAIARARSAIRWMETKINPDATIGDVKGPGEPAIAQLLASHAFCMAIDYSTRESLRQNANRLNSYALLKMKAKNGGYGPGADSAEPRADVLALSAFVYKFATLVGFKFDALSKPAKPALNALEAEALLGVGGLLTLVLIVVLAVKARRARKFSFSLLWLVLFVPAIGLLAGGGVALQAAARYAEDLALYEKNLNNTKVTNAIEDDILATLRAGFARLDSKSEATGAVFSATPGGPPDWRATVSGMQAMFLINSSRRSVNPALEFVFGPLDKKTESYPKILEHIAWGNGGDGYDAVTLWQGTIAVVYMFTEDKYESKTWAGNLRFILESHQGPDGSWPVAGVDARRGRVWRAALHAMTMCLTAPPPPPPAPPPDSTTTTTPAVPPVTPPPGLNTTK